ncbi:MAG: FtsX-like permease family protein [Patescibacteria group bacterium]
MRLDFSFFLSGSNLRQRKLRSFLTIGGLAVGVALIVFLVSLGFGLQRLIRAQITNVEALTVLDVSRGESSLLPLNDQTITDFKTLSNVKDVSASISLSGQIARQDSATDVAIYGISPQFISMEGVKLTYGQQFSAENAKEVLVTSTALNLIGLENAPKSIGEDVTLKVMVPVKREGQLEPDLVPTDLPVKVVGTMTDEELSIVYVPIKYLVDLGFPASYTEAKVKVTNEQLKQYSMAKVKVTDQSKLPEVRKQIQAMGYQVDSVADTVGQVDKIFLVFQLVVGGFGAIAMFVAALGALNTLTVSLLERTREIGLMKALGATSADIYKLFLTEAILMGVVGGMLGAGVGVGAGAGVNAGLRYLAQRLGGQPVGIFFTPWWFLIALLLLVTIISLITGFYPARRAATINVLEALHHQ